MQLRSIRQLAGVAVAVAALAMGLCAASASAETAPAVAAADADAGGVVPNIPPSSGYPNNMQFQNSGKCIEVSGAVTTNIQLDQYTCVLQANEYWYFDPVNSDGSVFRIRSGSSGKCMNVQGATLNNSAAIIQYPCGAYTNEYFEAFQVGSSDYYQFYTYPGLLAGNYKCLNMQGASTANHGKLIQYTCGSYSNEYIHLY